MSTRYVWAKYAIDIIQTKKTTSVQNTGIPVGTLVYVAPSYTEDASNGTFTLTGDVKPIPLDNGYGALNFPYLAQNKTSKTIFRADQISSYQWTNTSAYGYPYIGLYSGATMVNCTRIQYTSTSQKGDLQGYVTSTSPSAYPQDGISGSYWYTYQGSDSIDPESVSLPAEPRGGQQTTATVTPGTGKVYDGTVSYRYEYSVNGGTSWVLVDTRTETSISFTIPEGATTLLVRVRAQDDLGFTSSDYVTSEQVAVINNEPPTAPESISVGPIVAGQTVTITLTAATDPDGTIASYIYERSVDGNGWEQIHQGNVLSYTDTVGEEWASVTYRAKAVDDDGVAGPYVTGDTSVVNAGWLFISGPAADMGSKTAPFTVNFAAGVSGSSGVTGISMVIDLDGVEIYTGTVKDTDTIEIEMDNRLMGEGEHTIYASVSKEDYLPTSRAYVFSVPAISLPDGGRMELLEGQDGAPVFPVTTARAVIGMDGKSVEKLIEDLASAGAFGAKLALGSYTGSGTFGADTPNILAFAFAAKVIFVFDNAGAVTIIVPTVGAYVPGLVGSGAGTVTTAGTSVSWYSNSAANQLNTSGKSYTYAALG